METLGDLVGAESRAQSLRLSHETTVAEAASALARHRIGAGIIADQDGRTLALITQRDIAAKALTLENLDVPALQIADRTYLRFSEQDALYLAIGRMRAERREFCVVSDRRGRMTGVLSLNYALQAATAPQMQRIDSLTGPDNEQGLARAKAAQASLVHQLLEEGRPPTEIQLLLSRFNIDLYRRCVSLTLRKLESDGFGPAPVDFCVIVMGSAGRGESLLAPDQDNGLILEDYADAEHNTVDAWFRVFAERLVDGLDAIGIPRCKGDVMATNPLWRKTLPQWQAQVQLWTDRNIIAALRLADIFFDFQPVWGKRELSTRLRETVTDLCQARPGFLRRLYEDDQDKGVALGLFDRFILDQDDPDHKGEINLKLTGLIPLVEATRILSLREGLPETGTPGRIRGLAAKGVISANEEDYLLGAHRHITRLLLRRQAMEAEAGEPLSNHVHPGDLTTRESDMLVDSLKAIRRLAKSVRADFTGDVF